MTVIAVPLGLCLWLLFPLADASGSLGADPVFGAALLLLLLVRFASLPLAIRTTRKAARMDIAKSFFPRLRKQYGSDREGLSRAIMAIQRDLNVNPLNSCLLALFVVPLLGGFWALLKGLTIRSETGTFAPRFIPEDSAMYRHLNSITDLYTWGMDLTLTVPEVGLCARLTPYLLGLTATVALQCVQVRPQWRQHRPVAVILVVGSFGATYLLPIFFVLLKVADSIFLIAQVPFLKRVKRREFTRLRNDPVFMASVAELVADYLPNQDPPQPPHGHSPGRGAVDPDDLHR
ncbi:YidC/Oxa1 family membrane protein insertase [Geodermatophilus africanus]|nr:YidC/Oxa1 family membrane protein insertase [Geodermatophilus africanus]